MRRRKGRRRPSIGVSFEVGDGRDVRAARSVGLRQDDHAADDQPAGGADVGQDLHRRPRYRRGRSGGAAARHRLRDPADRALPQHDGRREHRRRAAAARLGRRRAAAAAPRSCWRCSRLPPAQFVDRYPNELSGGQAQRVGVARALAVDPPVLLMDEPFAALDPVNREAIQDEFLRMQRTLRKTILFVSHDIDEAVKMADRIAIFHSGRLVQYAAPDEMLAHPGRRFRRGLRRQRPHVEAAAAHPRARRHDDGYAPSTARRRRRRRSRRTTTCAASRRSSSSTAPTSLRCVDADGRVVGIVTRDAVAARLARRRADDERDRDSRPARSCRTWCSAGIAVAIAWGLYASGLAAEILRYRKDIVYLTKQHLVLVAVSGSAAIVSGVAHRDLAVAAMDGALGGRRDPGGQHGHVDPDAGQARADDVAARHRRAARDRRAVDRDAAADHSQHVRRDSRGAGASRRRRARHGHGTVGDPAPASSCRTRCS